MNEHTKELLFKKLHTDIEEKSGMRLKLLQLRLPKDHIDEYRSSSSWAALPFSSISEVEF